MWHELFKITHLRLPWLILGDFNIVLSRNEFNGGNFSYYDRKACSFKEFVDSSLLDLNFIDPSFTWCNNQNGSGRRWARLGRCLVNMDWINVFKFYKLQHLSRTFLITPRFFSVFHCIAFRATNPFSLKIFVLIT